MIKDRTLSALRELAEEIAADNGTWAGDAEWARAVQHVNETEMSRNAFSGVEGISLLAATRGLANYRADRRMWNVREYERDLAAGRIRCVAMRGHSTIPDGTIIHRNSPWIVESWRKASMVLASYPEADCPASSEHRR